MTIFVAIAGYLIMGYVMAMLAIHVLLKNLAGDVNATFKVSVGDAIFYTVLWPGVAIVLMGVALLELMSPLSGLIKALYRLKD